MKGTFLLFVSGAVLLEVIADVLFKYSVVQNKNSFWLAGIVLYIIGTAIWALLLRYEQLSKAIVIFAVLNIILVVLAGVFIFNESLTTMQKVGIVLGIMSVMLLEW
ncbi:MAG: Small Multidrug Resistance protein [Candidatus Parcubacteria bacterium]|jgi:multidrug transporter EmrE-like cation transporter